MSRRLPNPEFWHGRRVFLTGHTGFKGSWLTLWLNQLGADVCGYALAPPTNPNLFQLCALDRLIDHHEGDVRDADHLARTIEAFRPDVVLHLAAQALVLKSHAEPVETFATNVMGTVHLLDAIRQVPGIAVALVVTSDKVYAETNSLCRHDETDRLGGKDPYSASKACTELVVASFPSDTYTALATVRSGNVIGGGDWAKDRLVADLVQGLLQGIKPLIRNPEAVRPWQHVLDPLCGYLITAEHLSVNRTIRRSTWNFGPDAESEVPVIEIVRHLCGLWSEDAAYHVVDSSTKNPYEAPVLRLNSDKAREGLGWRPGWTLDEALRMTVEWFQAFARGVSMKDVTLRQIAEYCGIAYE